MTVLASSIFTPVQPSDAYRVATVLNSGGYTINLSASSQVGMNISTTAEGVYASAKDTLNIKTTAPGYALYLSMNNDDADGNRLYKDGNSTSADYLAPVSGTFNSPATLTNNSWGFAIAGDGGTFDTSYQTPTPAITSKWAAVPVRSNAVAIHTATAANPDPGDDIDIYYGVKANTALPSGVYSNTISYSAVASGVSLDVAAISPERTDKLAGGEQVTITTTLSATATDVGTVNVYIGGEACTNPVVSNGTSGNVIIKCYTPTHGTGTYDVTIDIPTYNKTYYIAGGLEYYQNYTPTLTDITYMHEMTSDVCARTDTPLSNATAVPEKTLIDVRGKDGTGTIENPATGANEQTYLVRKFADGNCWMTQNLNMDLNTAVTLNSTTSDLSAGRTWTPQNNTQTIEGTAWAQDGGDVARSFEPGEAMYFDGGKGTGTMDSATGNYPGYLSSGPAYWHVGNYYNWYAATAGTGTAAMATDSTPVNATDSICPKNWRLPDNSGSKSFINLVFTTYGLADNSATDAGKLLAAPLNFVRSGFYNWSEARVRYRGYNGRWWSNTAYSAFNAHYLNTIPSRVIPQDGYNKGYGFSVRCIAR